MDILDVDIKDYCENLPRNETLTRWHNPTPHTIRFTLYLTPAVFGVDGALERPPTQLPVMIPPGGDIELPSMFDNAIQTVRGGVITAGHAPMLLRAGQTEKLHPALAMSRTTRWTS